MQSHRVAVVESEHEAVRGTGGRERETMGEGNKEMKR